MLAVFYRILTAFQISKFCSKFRNLFYLLCTDNFSDNAFSIQTVKKYYIITIFFLYIESLNICSYA